MAVQVSSKDLIAYLGTLDVLIAKVKAAGSSQSDVLDFLTTSRCHVCEGIKIQLMREALGS